MSKRILLFLVLMFSGFLIGNNCQNVAKNLWQPRAFSVYGSREIIMFKDLYDHPFKHDAWDGTFSCGIEYMQNFGSADAGQSIGAMPFWSGTNTMIIGNNDGSADVDAYQFGMGNVSTQGQITLDPKIQHLGADMLLHFTRYKHDRGLFFKLKAPIGTMMIDSKLCEKTAILDGSTDDTWVSYPAPDNRFKTLTQAFAGGSVTADAVVSTHLHKPVALEYGRISCCKLTTIKLGDITAAVGCNVLGAQHYHLGFSVKLSCPTGTVPSGKYIFEPIFGRAGHWGIGMDLTGHYKHYFQDEKTMLDLWMQADVTHLTSGRKPNWRSFDLKKNGPGSKYMLVQFYLPANPTNENQAGRFPSFITQAINITTLPVLSTISVEGSLATLVELTQDNWTVGLGIDIWGRTKENLTIDVCNMINHNSASLSDFAVLGRQVSEDAQTDSPSITNLYLCEPCAKINKSEDRVLANQAPPPNGIPCTVTINQAPTSTFCQLNGDQVDDNTVFYDTTKIKDARLSENRIPSKFEEALDIPGAAEGRSLSGRIFITSGYAWTKRHYSPCLNVFAGFEISSFDSLRLNLWSFGIHGSLNF